MATLKKLREEVDKSRAQVAADLDLSERHLYRLENGTSRLRLHHRLMFASYYGVAEGEIEAAEERAA